LRRLPHSRSVAYTTLSCAASRSRHAPPALTINLDMWGARFGCPGAPVCRFQFHSPSAPARVALLCHRADRAKRTTLRCALTSCPPEIAGQNQVSSLLSGNGATCRAHHESLQLFPSAADISRFFGATNCHRISFPEVSITITIQYDNDNCKNSIAWSVNLWPLICCFVWAVAPGLVIRS
jgi:hypothetical protein